MHSRSALFAALSLVAFAAAPAITRAEVGASGTRLSIAGSPARSYMTYGHPEEPELYAPIVTELRRLQVTFAPAPDDHLAVIFRGRKVDSWPVVRSREALPETGDAPCILILGGGTYVPVRKIQALLSLEVKWEKRANVLSMDFRPERPRVAPRPGVFAASAPVTLTGVSLEEQDGGIQVRVRGSGRVLATWLRVNTPPARICLDFLNARWAEGLALPTPAGAVTAVRTGQPAGTTTARLTLEVNSADVKLTALRETGEEVTATVGRGVEIARISPEVRMALEIRRRPRAGDPASRGGVTPEIPGFPPIDVQPIRPEEPVRLPPLQFNPASSLAGRVICVDPGHGGRHIGSRGLNSTEKELCLQMGFQLRDALEKLGATVIMTRESDVFVSLDERCAIANNSGAELFLSIHCNAMPRPNKQNGSETYWLSSQESLRLARALHPRLVAAVRRRDGGVRKGNFQVIRETTMPSVLLEIAYLNHTEDEKLLCRPDFHLSLAESLAQGVLDYFGTELER